MGVSPSLPSIPDHRLIRRIGAGAYGEVWLARNLMGTGRAVKIIRRSGFDDERPFEREFEGLKRYEPVSRGHPGLVQILHIGRPADGESFYYVMELADDATVTGTGQDTQFFEAYRPRTLSSRLREQGVMTAAGVTDLAAALADALGHLHGCGLLHRDIKPANIIFVSGRPKFADIGLVAVAGGTRSFVGTEGYTPREGPGTEAADLFALGKVLYEAATGRDRMDFPALPASWLDSPERELLLELNEIWVRACAADPEHRYASAREMEADLAQLRGGRSVRQLRRMEGRLRWARRAAAVLAVGGGVTVAGWWWAQQQAVAERAMRERVEAAETMARTNLALARLEAARGWTVSREAGRRSRSLQALRDSAQVLGSVRELRDAAVAALASVDLEVEMIPTPGATPIRLGGVLELGADWLPSGEYSIRSVRDGSERFRVKAPVALKDGTGWFSPDEAWFAATGEDGRVWVWAVREAGRNPRSVPGGSGMSYDFLAQPARLVVGERSGRMRAWTLEGEPGDRPVQEVDLGTELSWLGPSTAGRVVVATKRGIHLLDAATLRDVALFPTELTGDPQAMLSADGRFVAALRSRREAIVWSAPGGEVMSTLTVNGRHCAALVFVEPDFLLSSGWDGRVRLFSLPGANVEVEGAAGFSRVVDQPSVGQPIPGAFWQPHRAGRLRVVQPGFSSALPLPVLPLAGSGAIQIVWSRGGESVVTVTTGGLDWMDGKTGRHRARLTTSVPLVAWFGGEADQLWVILDGYLWEVRLMPVGDSRWIRRATVPAEAHHGAGTADGRRVVLLAGSELVLIESGRESRRWAVNSLAGSVALSPDGRWVGVGTHHGDTAEMWAVDEGRLVQRWQDGPSILMGFSADGRRVHTASSTAVRWRETGTWREIRAEERAQTSGVAGLCSEDAAGSRTVWLRTRKELVFGSPDSPGGWFAVAPLPGEPVAALSPDGTRVAILDTDGRGRLWDLVRLERELEAMGLGWAPPSKATSGPPKER